MNEIKKKIDTSFELDNVIISHIYVSNRKYRVHSAMLDYTGSQPIIVSPLAYRTL